MAKKRTKIVKLRIKRLPDFETCEDTGDHIGELEFPEVNNNAFFQHGIERLKEECGIAPGIDLYAELTAKVDEAFAAPSVATLTIKPTILLTFAGTWTAVAVAIP